jgi:hypothetical protein
MGKPAFDGLASIPTGQELRVLLNSDHISYGEIQNTLKKKGIFVGKSDKFITVPILAATLLTPREFSNLIESSVDRESKPKVKVSALELVTPSSDWITPLKASLFTADFNPGSNIENVQFVDTPSVVVDGKDKVKIPYVINRRDYSKDWISREINFSGEIVIERQGKTLKLEFSSTHSSRETEAINRLITSRITKLLKDAGSTQNEKEKKITFGAFSNVERVRYFKRLKGGSAPVLSQGSVHDMEISRDNNCPPLPKDPQVDWMNETVTRLRIDGEKLNNIFLISDEKYYPHYYVLRIDITFPYQFRTMSGSCRVVFSFSPISRTELNKNDAELTFEFSRVTHERTINSDAKRELCSSLERAIRVMIESEYDRIVSERAA